MDDMKVTPRTPSRPLTSSPPPVQPVVPANPAAQPPATRRAPGTGDLNGVNPTAMRAARARSGQLPALPAGTPPGRVSLADLRKTGGAVRGDHDKADNHSVAGIQEKLKNLKDKNGQPYYKGEVDGKFGPETEKAVRAFQADQKAQDPSFQVDGKVGPQTKGALDKATQTPAPANTTQTPVATPSDATTPTPEVSNSEATNFVPMQKNPDGTPKLGPDGKPMVDNAALDKMTVDQRKALLKGLEGGKVYTSDQEDALKGAVANSLARTNPEAIDADTAKTINRGLRDLGDPAKMGTNPATGKPYTADEAKAVMDNFAKKNPEGVKAAMAQDSTTWSGDHQADQAAYGRMGAALVRAEVAKGPNGDPAKVMADISKIGGTFDGTANAAQVAKNLSDKDLDAMKATPKGQEALKALYDGMNNKVFSNDAAQAEQRGRVFARMAGAATPDAPSNSEATNFVPMQKNPDGSPKLGPDGKPMVDNAALDKMSVDQRKALLKGLEGGSVYTSDQEDALKGAVANSLMRTNPEAIDADTAKTINRGLHDLGDPAKMGTNPATGKPYTQAEANALMDNFAKKNPEGLKAAMAADSTTWSNDHEADQAAYGRMGAAMVRAEASKPGGGDPAKVLADISKIGGTFDGTANATQIAKNLSDADLTKLQGTPKGQDFLRTLYANMNNAVFWNSSEQNAQRARLFPHLNAS